VLASQSHAQQLAFPGADGFGRFAQGGRGGVVYQVTNLNNSGTGSLRACVEASGPRTCVFRVAGDILLDSELRISNPYLTVAGQTAPGQGVQLRHSPLNIRNGFQISADHVVIQHVKIRLGPSTTISDIPNCIQVLLLPGSAVPIRDWIVDNISCYWATDQLIAVSPDTERGTLQESIFAEGLNASSHTQGVHSKGPNFRACGVTFVRGLIANNVIRNPNQVCGHELYGGTQRPTTGNITGQNEFRNNIVFNGQDAFMDYFNGRGESWVNVAGNVFIRGPSTKNKLQSNIPHGIYAIDAWDFESRFIPSASNEPMHLCLQDNIGINLPTNTTGGAAIHGVLNPNDAHIVDSTDCVNNPVLEPGATQGLTGPLIAASTVEATIVPKLGAIWWNRDATDTRLLNALAARTGAIIDHPNDVGGWAVMASGTNYTDADADGMDDAWETTYGLNPASALDRNLDADGDGFTNLDEFLSHAARDQVGMGSGTPPPPPPPPPPATPVLDLSPATLAQAEGNSGTTAYVFTVTRSVSTSGASAANWAVTGTGTNAAAASDFVGAAFQSGTVNFVDTDATETITINVQGDTDVELNEQFRLTLSSPTGSVLGSAFFADGTITNDDTAPGGTATLRIAANNAARNETNSGTMNYAFTVTREVSTSGTASVTWTAAPTGANPADASDFVGGTFPTGTVNFADTDVTEQFNVPIAGDDLVEPNESFAVNLSEPVNATLGTPSTATGVITNDDVSPVLTIAADAASANEGNSGTTAFNFTVTRTGSTAQTSSVDWIVSSTVADVNDFPGQVWPTGSVSFGVGQSTRPIVVNVVGDTAEEANEPFEVGLTGPGMATLGSPSSATATITNDDAAPAPPPTPAFGDGVRIRVSNVAGAEVRRSPRPTGTLVATQPFGRVGTIVRCSGTCGTSIWWRISFDIGRDGWVKQDDIEVNP
jgi:hypothetical protein